MSAEVKPGSLCPKGYKQTEVGVIPEEWEVKTLCNVAEIRSGIAKNSNISVRDPILVHYLRVANVQDGFLDLTEMSMIEVTRHDLKRYAVLPGDVLMNEGGDLDKLGRGSVWQGEFIPCVHQNHVFVVRCRSTISHEYLNIWTGTTTARRYFLVAGKQTTNLATINKTALGQLPVVLPRLPEQRTIAEALSDVDALLGALDRLITKKRDLKQAAIQQLLTGQTRLPGFHGEWEVKRLGELFEITSSKRVFQSEWKSEGVPFYRARELAVLGETGRVDNDLFITKPLYESFKNVHGVPEVGDMLVTGVGTLGKVYVVADEQEFYFKDGNIIWFKIGGKVSAEFLRQLYLTKVVMKQITDASAGTTVGTYTISGAKKTKIPFPSLPEQTAIAAVLSDMDAELAALEQRRDKTHALKQGMMQELLTGRIRLV